MARSDFAIRRRPSSLSLPDAAAPQSEAPHVGGHADRLRHAAGLRRQQEQVQGNLVRRVHLRGEV